MADNDRNDNGRRPSRGRPGKPGSPRGDRPFRQASDKGAPFRARGRDGDGPRRPRDDGDRPFRKPRAEGDRPFRKREDGDRPFRKARPEGDRPFRKPRDAGEGPRKRFDRPRDERPPVRRVETAPAAAAEPADERIAKVIARAGIASRRDAEAMIAEGRVTLNGEVLASPAINVTANDRITVDGEPLPARERTRLWIFHKPRGLVTTARDPQGRPTVFESLPEDMPRVVAVGRLDINTEGLLLLTNDGGLARVIAHPDTGWLRRYKVRAHGEITQERLDTLRDGITIDGIDYGPIEARLDRIQGDNAWLTLGLREGKNREIKNILEHLGLNVNRLIRLSFGPFQLGDLEPGLVEEVRTKVLREQLGQKLAEKAGVDFASPVREPIAPFGAPKREERGERPERGSRFERERDERPRRARDDERPRGDRDGERPFRARDERPSRGRRDEEAPRERPVHRAERRPSVWRADADEGAPRRPKAPRRGADPKEARAASGERKHERVGAIASEGGRVVVERLVSEPKPEGERPARRPRQDGSRPAPRGDDRPRRREKRDFVDRPVGDRTSYKERGPRNDDGRDGPHRGGSRDDGARRSGGFGKGARNSGPRSSGPGRGGPRGAGPRGASKGPPRDRRS
jgi:23S rRNA pseudouridine2605 synthase